MIHLAVIGEAGAVLGSAWLVRRFYVFRFGEDAGQVAEILRQMRLRTLRGESLPSPQPADTSRTAPQD